MNLVFSDEQRMLAESVRRALSDVWDYDHLRRIADGPARDDEVWRLLGELGCLALPFSEADGGLGLGTVEAGIVAEELGRAGVLNRWVATVVLAGGLIEALGDGKQRTRLLAPLIEGRSRPALAHPDPGRDPTVTAVSEGTGYRLDGTAPLVLGGDAADVLLVAARAANDSDRLGVFAVAADAQGVTRAPCDTVEGGRAADLTFDGVAVDADALLGGCWDAAPVIAHCHDRANAAQCADAAGAMAALLAATVAYTGERRQFGQPLSSFQALRHRIAEMALKVEEARAAALLAALSVDGTEVERTRGVSGARATIGPLTRHVAHETIQLHGAMGVSEEMPLGAALRRLLAFEHTWGTTEWHLRRYGEAIGRRRAVGAGLLREGEKGEVNLGMTADDVAFRDEVRAFLDAELTPELRRAERLNPSFLADAEVGLAWQRKLAARGWAAPSWPAEHGGPGWSLTRRYIFDQECARAGEPAFRGAGIKMLAPVLMRFGTPEQQAAYLPRILSGDDLWAQGYSEPGSGSDLASLATRAVRDGDAYVVSGTKIWSTLAHTATLMFALVRTDDSGRKQEGITFLLIDLAAPGVEIRPIRSIDGSHEFNQVFFDGVRVPVSDRVGEEGQGWQIAKYLLEFERGGSFAGGVLRAHLVRLHRLAAAPGPGGAIPFDDPLLRARFAEVAAAVDTNDMLELIALSQAEAGGRPGAVASSTMKIERSRIRQAIAQLAVHALGPDALRWERHRPLHELPEADELQDLRRVAGPAYLASRAQSLLGGTNEIQLEIIARAVIG